jgi:hypothetical protein
MQDKNSPPQLRRGGAERRGGAGQEIDLLSEPPRRFSLGFALSGSRFAAAPRLNQGGDALSRRCVRSRLAVVAGALLLLSTPAWAQGPQPSRLETAKSIKCTFPLISTGNWNAGQAEAAVKPATLVVEFESVNADEGSAQLQGGFGVYDIVVRFASGYLHFIQSFRDGPLYTTTVFDKPSSGMKLKAVHSRHEILDRPLTGYTSSPEQYYGECEIVN